METINLELTDQELFELMRLAHEQDITLNQLIHNVLQQVVDSYKEPGDDDSYSFKTAGFGTDEDYGGHHDRI